MPCWTGGNELKDSLKFLDIHEDQDRQLLIKSFIAKKKLDLSINVSTLKDTLENQSKDTRERASQSAMFKCDFSAGFVVKFLYSFKLR